MNEHEQAELAISEGVERELERLTDQSERAERVLEQRELIATHRRLPPAPESDQDDAEHGG